MDSAAARRLLLAERFRISATSRDWLALPPYGSTTTGMPTHAASRSVYASQFAKRKHPCDSVRPTFSGEGVP